MGPLTIPSTGPVYLDANAFIYSVERIEPYNTLLQPLWNEAHAGRFSLVSSELVILETLVGPMRQRDTLVADLFRSLFNSNEVALIAPTRQIWELAASLRAELGLQSTDALHAATAIAMGCTQFVTNDTDFRRVRDLPTVILDDLSGGITPAP